MEGWGLIGLALGDWVECGLFVFLMIRLRQHRTQRHFIASESVGRMGMDLRRPTSAVLRVGLGLSGMTMVVWVGSTAGC